MFFSVSWTVIILLYSAIQVRKKENLVLTAINHQYQMETNNNIDIIIIITHACNLFVLYDQHQHHNS